ncbi:MFS transporter [Actinocrispum sp. NPDC049592]|uniref:MFS transporter n=1 Tax=Actinocrispum sp. NPDC049592 TaxID=3154835 RepID=UPI00342D22E8
MVTDISAEMVTAVLPVYLVLGLHLTPVAYGLVDGLYTGATALLRLVGGYIADRVRTRKAVAGVGYGLSAVTKLGLLLVGGSVTAIGAMITLDRAGKGLRTAPRDALITLSAPQDMLGRAFGVHRAMDSLGAFAGPLVALAVLAAVGSGVTTEGFDAVFVTSFCFALLGVALLVLFVKDRRGERPASNTVSPKVALALLVDRRVRKIMIIAAIIGLSTIGDGFVYLLLQRREDIAIGWFPLLAVGTNLAYLALAAPFGALADRFGRLPVVVGGYVALLAVYVLVFGPFGGVPVIVLTLALYGTFYAATDGVLIALAGPVLPEALRTTGIALIQTTQAVAYFVSSVAFGLVWASWG